MVDWGQKGQSLALGIEIFLEYSYPFVWGQNLFLTNIIKPTSLVRYN